MRHAAPMLLLLMPRLRHADACFFMRLMMPPPLPLRRYAATCRGADYRC